MEMASLNKMLLLCADSLVILSKVNAFLSLNCTMKPVEKTLYVKIILLYSGGLFSCD